MWPLGENYREIGVAPGRELQEIGVAFGAEIHGNTLGWGYKDGCGL